MENQLRLAQEEFDSIEQLAGVGYTPEKIAQYLDVDKELFMKRWHIKDSPIRYAYDKGALQTEFNTLNQQRELAESGNITAAQIFLKEKERIRIDNIRKQCLFQE
ncbi:hypothetical protein SAMN05216480_10533 [Pustulibacterium marinum]|uniref:Uncharacterized protein n=1 Tax=Pustulibacterium marinum TaxID=1224947 RepID=A0A1I7GKI9_9FLAO|nr:hypothetical protein [Pustulibacterium marinum]SFU48987.1 hypothetical protein SAMN05216480_10533 [Pustulibacterium marinum]